jgi:hypothetical protein
VLAVRHSNGQQAIFAGSLAGAIARPSPNEISNEYLQPGQLPKGAAPCRSSHNPVKMRFGSVESQEKDMDVPNFNR